MRPFLGGFLSELEKLAQGAGIGTPPLVGRGMTPPPAPPGNVGPSMGTGQGAFVAPPPKAAPAGASTKTELEKRVAGGVNRALGGLGATVNKPYKDKGPKLDLRAPKTPK